MTARKMAIIGPEHIDAAHRISHDLLGLLTGELLPASIDPMSGARIRNNLRGLLDRVVALEDLLRDVANSGIVLEDQQLKYVVAHIDRETWQQLQRFKECSR